MNLPTAVSVDIVPFTTINHEAQKMLGITNDEYCVANAIHNLSHNPKGSIPGWCYAKKEYIAASVNVSRASAFRHVKKLLKLGLIELHADQPNLMRTTAKWYDSVMIKKIEMIIEDNATTKPQSQNETESLSTKSATYQGETASLKMRLDQSQNETDIYKDLQGELNKDIETKNYSSNEELQQAVNDVRFEIEVLEGEITSLPKSKSKTSAKKREPNPDGTYGDPRINAVQMHFLTVTNLEREDCTQRESRLYWKKLLDEVKEGHDQVEGVNKLIDIIPEDEQLAPNITSSKALYYKKGQLLSRYRARTKMVATKSNMSGNIRGGIAWH